jgi:FkbM family methyltransferase
MEAYLFPIRHTSDAGAKAVDIAPEALQSGVWTDRTESGVPVAQNCKIIKRVYRHLMGVEGGVIVDVGANTGTYALLAALLPSIRVMAFEPNPQTFEWLRDSLRRNAVLDRVDAFQLAASDRNGDAMLSVPRWKESVLATLSKPRYFEADGVVQVQTTTLDSFLKDHPLSRIDVLKIDTEGAEKFVLQGARETIGRFRPIMIVECGKLQTRQFGYERTESIALIEELEYRVERSGRDDVWCVPNEHAAAGTRT